MSAGRFAARAQPVVQDDGLRLRPWAADDVPAVVAAYDDPAIQQWHVRSMTTSEARRWVAGWQSSWESEAGASWAVEVDGVVVGQVGLRQIRLGEGSAAMSYWVLPASRGRGAATRALTLVTRWAFGQVGLHRIELRHSTRNAPSCRVAVKAGYLVEGTARGDGLHADGWHDMHVHARLCTD